MSNHYHILLETPIPNLSDGMRQLNGVYTQRFNKLHSSCGHVFSGRFKSTIVDKDSYLLELCRYIVLNPVRAKIVTIPEQFFWSSYSATIGSVSAPEFLNLAWLTEIINPDFEVALNPFQDFVNDGINNVVNKTLNHKSVI